MAISKDSTAAGGIASTTRAGPETIGPACKPKNIIQFVDAHFEPVTPKHGQQNGSDQEGSDHQNNDSLNGFSDGIVRREYDSREKNPGNRRGNHRGEPREMVTPGPLHPETRDCRDRVERKQADQPGRRLYIANELRGYSEWTQAPIPGVRPSKRALHKSTLARRRFARSELEQPIIAKPEKKERGGRYEEHCPEL